MRKIKIVFVILIMLGCTEKSPFEVKQHSLALPQGAPVINLSELKSDNDFSIGYNNGSIRSDRVTLHWQASTDANFLCYKVFRNNFQVVVIGKIDSTTLTDSSFVSQNTYYLYKVVTMSQRGTSVFDTVTVKTPQFDNPIIQGHEVLSDSSLKIYWENRAESATTFAIDRLHPDSTLFTEVATVPDTFYVDSDNITRGRIYRYRVTAKNPYESTTPSLSYSVLVP